MAFAPLHTLVCVVATDTGRFLDRLDALTIHDRRAGIGVTAHALPFGAMQRRIQPMPDASQAKATKMGLHGRGTRMTEEPAAGRGATVGVEPGVTAACRTVVPAPRPRAKGGRPPCSDREMLGAILAVLRTGLRWLALPRDPGATTTVSG